MPTFIFFMRGFYNILESLQGPCREKTYALKKGFYVIEASGETFNSIEPQGGYHPHEWRATETGCGKRAGACPITNRYRTSPLLIRTA
jgi:hypothetical protein